MRRFNVTLIFLIVLSTQLLGCKKEDPNPELKDPIYSDLLKRATESQKAYEDAKVKIEALRLDLAKAEPNSIDVKDIQKELAKTEQQRLRAEQEARYFKIRSERRKYEDRMEYKKAFAKNEEWPNKREYSDYLVNIRLREINLNWTARVPKLQDRRAASIQKQEKPAEAPKKGH